MRTLTQDSGIWTLRLRTQDFGLAVVLGLRTQDCEDCEDSDSGLRIQDSDGEDSGLRGRRRRLRTLWLRTQDSEAEDSGLSLRTEADDSGLRTLRLRAEDSQV